MVKFSTSYLAHQTVEVTNCTVTCYSNVNQYLQKKKNVKMLWHWCDTCQRHSDAQVRYWERHKKYKWYETLGEIFCVPLIYDFQGFLYREFLALFITAIVEICYEHIFYYYLDFLLILCKILYLKCILLIKLCS